MPTVGFGAGRMATAPEPAASQRSAATAGRPAASQAQPARRVRVPTELFFTCWNFRVGRRITGSLENGGFAANTNLPLREFAGCDGCRHGLFRQHRYNHKPARGWITSVDAEGGGRPVESF